MGKPLVYIFSPTLQGRYKFADGTPFEFYNDEENPPRGAGGVREPRRPNPTPGAPAVALEEPSVSVRGL